MKGINSLLLHHLEERMRKHDRKLDVKSTRNKNSPFFSLFVSSRKMKTLHCNFTRILLRLMSIKTHACFTCKQVITQKNNPSTFHQQDDFYRLVFAV